MTDIPAKRHYYTEPKIEFAADGKSATASKVCKNCGHKVSEECTVTSRIIKLPTEAEPGEHIYHAKGLGAEASKTIADISFWSSDTQHFFAMADASRRPPEFLYSLSDAVLETYLDIMINHAPETIAGILSDDELQAWSCSTNMSHNFPVEVTTDQSDKLRQDFIESLRRSKALMEDELKRRKKNSTKEQAKSKEKTAVAKTDASPKAAKIKKKVSDILSWLKDAALCVAFLVVSMVGINLIVDIPASIFFPEYFAETSDAEIFEGISRWIGTGTRITQEIENIASVQVGETVEFGVYEQDNKELNGKEPISWRVLDVVDGKALLISEKALDGKQLNDSKDKGFNYETSDLNTWLKGDFTNEVFSSEKEKNLLSTLPFCLSRNDANAYFSSDEDRVCYPTAYAKTHGAWSNSDYNNACNWALSSITRISDGVSVYVDCVDYDGSVSIASPNQHRGVRPAIWVNVGAEQA